MTHGTPDIEKTTENFDAERMVEEIETGDRSEPQVNVSSDYEKSKLYSQPDTIQDEKGPDISTTVPDEFLDMAKSIQPDEGA
jgi:hypothetical protein